LEPIAKQTYADVKAKLSAKPRRWLITGVAGFIGSNLLEQLLLLDQAVVGLDNFSTGNRNNIDEVLRTVSTEQASRFRFVEGDIRDLETCKSICRGVNIVLQQAALGSVPRSVADPITTNQNNVDGFLNILVAAKAAGVERLVYASSSSVYGDSPELPKVEERIGNPLSPYAVTKYANELYAAVFGNLYRLPCIGLRYFNVFGRRQDPNGAYAAVIPKWFADLLKGEVVYINGDGETSRDFCYIDNVVQANLLAACVEGADAVNQVYNVACGRRTTLKELFAMIRELIVSAYPDKQFAKARYRDFLAGEVRHSHADISKATRLLGYHPDHTVQDGLSRTSDWYQKHHGGAL